ncbi:MAG TPA: glycerol-3-phosphate 1-O-acyltransferase PlsY [Acidimicrobiia bacterium]|nr:glycerol-3-phosphate 1-O-acyltransferase PlsY [Acidimicrobiia bacterium]
MTESVAVPLALVAAYLIGSIDFAVVVARMHGVDIHQVGSGNPGTANVLRTLGRGPAIAVLVGDMMKGVLAAGMGMVAGGDPIGVWAFAAGLAAVVGHCYPIFHRFKGGKGVATAVGVVALTVPLAALVMGVVWGAIVGITRISALGSLGLSVAAVPLAIWRGVEGPAAVVLGVIFLLVIWRHRGNIRRLLAGEERTVTGN